MSRLHRACQVVVGEGIDLEDHETSATSLDLAVWKLEPAKGKSGLDGRNGPAERKAQRILQLKSTNGRTIVATGGGAYKDEVDGEGMTEREARLSHVNAAGEAHMVDVTEKDVTTRDAEARGRVRMTPQTLDLIRRNSMAKGDVLAVARVAGVMGAKRTSELIPLCHGLPLTGVDIGFELNEAEACVEIVAQARTAARTGVEMEALTAVTVAGLTIYDMCKAVDRGMRLTDVRLTFKSGGKSGTYRSE